MALGGGGQVRVDVLADRLFRIRYSKTGEWTESGLNRARRARRRTSGKPLFEKAEANGVHTLATKQAKLAIRGSDETITWPRMPPESRSPNRPRAVQAGGGCDVRFALSNDERLYGMGDVSRENVMR